MPAKVWTIFAKVSKILGIVCISTSWIPYFGLVFSLSFAVVGIVMACLGRRAKTEVTDQQCRIGLILNIVTIPVAIALFILEYLLLLGSLLAMPY